MTLTIGSLFSGIGGLDLGLERAGMVVKWQVEKDEYARRVLAKHWPTVPCYDDVRHCRGPGHGYTGHMLQYVDLICGGFPCQDISLAGKGAGIKEGTRSGLWSEYARIVREVRPRYVLVENVAALRSRGLDRVLGDLAALGYDAEWDCIPAAAVGAPHRRDRIFVVAYADGQRLAERRECDRHTEAGQQASRRDHARGLRTDVPNAQREPVRDEPGRGSGTRGPGPHVFGFDGITGSVARPTRSSQWEVEPDVGRVADRVAERVDRLRCLGNAVVPQVAEYVGRLIIAHAERSKTSSESKP